MFFFNKNSVKFLIVGLGNVGPKYSNTRHNTGFAAVDHLANEFGISTNKIKFKALFGTGLIEKTKVALIKPTTFMNNSGEAVELARNFFKLTPEQIIVLYDDISFDVGQFKIKTKGSSGGHNGLKSIENSIGSSEYLRIKIGISAKPNAKIVLSDWVLSKFNSLEQSILEETFVKTTEAVKLIVSSQIDKAMLKFN